MRVPSVPTGCEDYDSYVAKAGVWLRYEERLLQEARFEEMPRQEEKEQCLKES